MVDDHDRFRERLVAILTARPELDLVGEAADAPAAVELVGRRRPDLVLMDLHMPGGTGVDATRQIRVGVPRARILILSVSSADEMVTDAMLAGASGYVLKSAPGSVILSAVAAVVAGDTFLSPEIASKLVDRWRRQELGLRATQARPPTDLSPREVQVLQLLAEGRENAGIADALKISPNTVKRHVAAVLDKLDAPNRTAAAVRAVRDELIGPRPEEP